MMTSKKIKKIINSLPSIDKQKICKEISNKTQISNEHVISVVNLLLEEIFKELKKGNKIHIRNFGSLEIFQPKPKKIVNINTGKEEMSIRKKRLRFRLDDQLSWFVSKLIDTE